MRKILIGLVIAILLYFSFLGAQFYCPEAFFYNWETRVAQNYGGATWSDDSKQVYFAKHIRIFRVLKRGLRWGEPPPVITLEKLVIYCFNVRDRSLKVVTDFDDYVFHPVPPFARQTFLFNSKIENNKVYFITSADSDRVAIYVDVFTGQHYVNGAILGDGITRKDRLHVQNYPHFSWLYFSSDGNSFIEIPEDINCSIKIFHKPLAAPRQNNVLFSDNSMEIMSSDPAFESQTLSFDDLVTPGERMQRLRYFLGNRVDY